MKEKLIFCKFLNCVVVLPFTVTARSKACTVFARSEAVQEVLPSVKDHETEKSEARAQRGL
jgi:hypothetical protein